MRLWWGLNSEPRGAELRRIPFLIAAAVLGASPVFASVYECSIMRASGHAPLTPEKIRFELSDFGVEIRDDVMQGAGLVATDAELDRIVRGEQIITWKLTPIPAALKPPERGNKWSTLALYRARLGLEAGTLKLTAQVVAQWGNNSVARHVDAFGLCKIEK